MVGISLRKLEDANDGYVINGLCLNIQNIKDTEEVLISAREKAEESDRMKSLSWRI